MKSKKLLRLIFSLALVTLTFLSMGTPQAAAVPSCDAICYRAYQRCLTSGTPPAECEATLSACWDNCALRP